MGRRQFGSVRRLPSGRWQARYWNGLGERITAPETFANKGDAQRWLATVQAEQLKGTYVDPRAGRVLFADWAESWLASKPDKRAASIARDAAALHAHFNPAFGHLPLSAITPVHVRGVVDVMRAKDLTAKSIRTYVGTLAAVFNAAVEADLIPRTPVRGLHLEKSRRRERPTITMEQLFALVDQVPPRFQALVLVASVLGLRWSEAIGLRVRDVDLIGKTLSVRQTIEEVAGRIVIADATKSAASRRTIAVPTSVIDALAEHLATFRPDAEADDLIFVGARGGILRRHFLPRVLKPAAERAGLAVGRRKGLDFHGLRHVATTMMVSTGEHPRVMQNRLGHATPTLTLGLYAHVPDDVDRAAATHLDELIAAQRRARPAKGTRRARPTQ